MSRNPYEPPKAKISSASSTSATTDTPDADAVMCTADQLAVAAFIGGPVPSAWLAANNYSAIGQPDQGRQMIGWSFLALFVLVGIGFVLPEQIPSIVLPIAYSFTIRSAAEAKFGATVKAHREAGGLIMSWWRVVGVTLLCVLIVFAVAFLALLLLAEFGLNLD